MQPVKQAANVLADNEAPNDTKMLKKQAIYAILELDNDEKILLIERWRKSKCSEQEKAC